MPITLNGSGTVSGISAGGLPDGIIQSADLATGVGGKLLQVVTTNITSTSSVAFGSYSLAASTPVTATITSTAANSKFIVSCCTNGESSLEDHETHFVLRRIIGGSGTSIHVGDADGVRPAVSAIKSLGYYSNDQDSTPSGTHVGPYLDSPSQAAGTAITYGMFAMGRGAAGTFYYGRTVSTSNAGPYERLPNNMLIMEIAA
jgi:hypothetical protein